MTHCDLLPDLTVYILYNCVNELTDVMVMTANFYYIHIIIFYTALLFFYILFYDAGSVSVWPRPLCFSSGFIANPNSYGLLVPEWAIPTKRLETKGATCVFLFSFI